MILVLKKNPIWKYINLFLEEWEIFKLRCREDGGALTTNKSSRHRVLSQHNTCLQGFCIGRPNDEDLSRTLV